MNIDSNNFTIEELAKIYNTLNRWEWASELGNKPENWDEVNRDGKYDLVIPIINQIRNKIGLKECLRWHHIYNLQRTNQQFENWWAREKNGLLWKAIEPNQI